MMGNTGLKMERIISDWGELPLDKVMRLFWSILSNRWSTATVLWLMDACLWIIATITADHSNR